MSSFENRDRREPASQPPHSGLGDALMIATAVFATGCGDMTPKPDTVPSKDAKPVALPQIDITTNNTMLNAVRAERQAVVSEMLASNPSPGMRQLLASPSLPVYIERAAAVLSKVRDEKSTVDLREVEALHGPETRQFVAGLLQHQLKTGFPKLFAELERRVHAEKPGFDFGPADVGIKLNPIKTIDGDWGPQSSRHREDFQALMALTASFSSQRGVSRPHQNSPHDTEIGKGTLAAFRYVNPSFSAFMVKHLSFGDPGSPLLSIALEEYGALKTNALQESGLQEEPNRARGASWETRFTPPGMSTPAIVRGMK